MDGNQNSGIPFGFRFNPTEEELISYYLKNKILGLPMMNSESNLIVDAVVYGDNATPWEAFQHFPWQPVVDLMGKFESTESILYVFTKLSNVGKTEKSENKQKNRVAGCGTWHGNTPSQPVFDGNGRGEKMIGHRRTLTFRSNQETVGQWTMYEYTIDPAAHGINSGNGFEDIVLCKIKWNKAKSSKGGKLIRRKRDFTSIMSTNEDHDQGQLPLAVLELPQVSEFSYPVPLAIQEDDVSGIIATNHEYYNSGHQYFQGETSTLMIEQGPNNFDFCTTSEQNILLNPNPDPLYYSEEHLQNPNLGFDVNPLLIDDQIQHSSMDHQGWINSAVPLDAVDYGGSSGSILKESGGGNREYGDVLRKDFEAATPATATADINPTATSFCGLEKDLQNPTYVLDEDLQIPNLYRDVDSLLHKIVIWH